MLTPEQIRRIEKRNKTFGDHRGRGERDRLELARTGGALPPRTDAEALARERLLRGNAIPSPLPYRVTDDTQGLFGRCAGDYADRHPREPAPPPDDTSE